MIPTHSRSDPLSTSFWKKMTIGFAIISVLLIFVVGSMIYEDHKLITYRFKSKWSRSNNTSNECCDTKVPQKKCHAYIRVCSRSFCDQVIYKVADARFRAQRITCWNTVYPPIKYLEIHHD